MEEGLKIASQVTLLLERRYPVHESDLELQAQVQVQLVYHLRLSLLRLYHP